MRVSNSLRTHMPPGVEQKLQHPECVHQKGALLPPGPTWELHRSRNCDAFLFTRGRNDRHRGFMTIDWSIQSREGRNRISSSGPASLVRAPAQIYFWRGRDIFLNS